MDIMLGLTAATQSINIVKNLRDIERDLDSASYKAQMAELYGALADVKMALTDAKTELHDKDQEIKKLKDVIEDIKKGDTCPLCEEGRMKVTASIPHPEFAFAGVQQQTVTCQNLKCSHSEEHLHDPRNATGTQG